MMSLGHYLEKGIARVGPSLTPIMDVDISQPAAFVNAELLPMYIGKKVRTVVQVLRVESGSFVGKPTDGRELEILIKGFSQSLTNFVEVIGVADSNNSIVAEKITNFGDNIDIFTFNRLCQLANGEYKKLFL